MMRFVCSLLAFAAVAAVAACGDGSTATSDMRRRGGDCLARSRPPVIQRQGQGVDSCKRFLVQQASNTGGNTPTSASPHGTAAPERPQAPTQAEPGSSSWRKERGTASWRRMMLTSPEPDGRLRALLRVRSPVRLRGGSVRAERRASEEHQRVRSVLLYYPNLIGYARIALVLASYYLAETNWKASMGFYLLAFAGDAVDGHVARAFNQASRFGAVLDMVTDRCSTAGLLLVLSRLYGRLHAFAFLVLMFVDLFSHWMHTHSVVDKHHKSTTTLRRRNVLIRTYYDHLPFFAFCCIGTELFYVLLYLLHFVSEDALAFPLLRKLCFGLCMPACVLKQFINVAQILSAARTLALEELDQDR